MTTREELTRRVRGEYDEMPGLSLTLTQAARLWHIEEPVCAAILDALTRENFLTRTPAGTYVALPRPRTPLKASLRDHHAGRRSA